MTVTVRDQIELNGYKYKIKGAITGGWIDPFPEQFTLGDPDYSNRRDLSSWIINDLRGGIGVEEMDEKVDWNKCWWTDCIIKYRNHILPPRLATKISTFTDATDQNISPTGGSGTGWTNPANSYDGDTTSAADVDHLALNTYSNYLTLTIPATYCSAIRIWVTSDGTPTVDLDAYYDSTWNSVYEGTVAEGAWVSKSLSSAHTVTSVRIRMKQDDSGDGDVDVFEIELTMPQMTKSLNLMENFNGEKYLANANQLMQLDSDRAGYTGIQTFPATITAIISSLNSRLYIYLGDDNNYWYMDVGSTSSATLAEDLDDSETGVDVSDGTQFARGNVFTIDSERMYVVSIATNTLTVTRGLATTAATHTSGAAITTQTFTESITGEAYWAFQFDAKLFKCNTDGTVEYSTDPDDATPTWTSGGAITDIADQIEGFVVGRDASGAYVPYAATNSIIKAYDSATPQWIDTEAVLPNHPIGGKGHAYWNGKLYFTYGLPVKEYYPEAGAYIDIGLTERDGLPLEYNGEIVKLLGDTGVKGMFAAIDSSVTSGNSKSGLYLYDGLGWQCWWADTSDNGTMHDIVVSSVASEYAVYWDCGGGVFYIDIPRGIENPDKISQSYGAAGILLTPWFDAGNPTAAKLAKLLSDYAKGVTPTETVALKYRIDHISTDLDSGWTTMDTLNTLAESGYNEELFASGAGTSFKAIQFRLDFVVGSGTTDVGSAATARAEAIAADVTAIDLDNPASADGTITSIDIWAATSMTVVRVGSFYLVSGNVYKCRASQYIGSVTAGSKQTFAVSIPITTGDYIGCYFATGTIEHGTGGTGVKYISGEYIDPDDSTTYSTVGSKQLSLYGTVGGVNAKADVQSLVLYLKKRTGSAKFRTWNVTIICDNLYQTSAKEKTANLKSAIESATDVVFSYHPDDASTESYYVTVDCPEFNEQTGREYEANYALRLTES